jgi:hypothetical protein
LRNPNSGVYERIEKAYRGFDQQNFDQTKAKVNRAFRRALGERLASPYLIVKTEPIAGSRLHRFGLSLPPDAITIAPASLPAQRRRADKVHIRSSKRAVARKSR